MIPSPEEQVAFIVRIQRILAEGSFVASYKYALLLALADLAVERGDDTTEVLHLDTLDLAEKYVDLYWRQVLPWPAGEDTVTHPLSQATGPNAAILARIAKDHRAVGGSLPRLRQDRPRWKALLRDVGTTVAVMPLWRLQTIGSERLDFLYPNVGRGRRIALRGDAVYCFRRFRSLIGDLVQGAWVRFVRGLPRNRKLLGESADLMAYLFGSERSATTAFRAALREHVGNRCFYCARSIAEQPAVDHFIPWARFPMDLGHNLVLAHPKCNGDKRDRLAALDHLAHWRDHVDDDGLRALFDERSLPHDLGRTLRVARWAYSTADGEGTQVWQRGKDGLVALTDGWRHLLDRP